MLVRVSKFMDAVRSELLNHTNYLYGYKGEMVTESNLSRFIKQYPDYYTEAKTAKAKKKIGYRALDCSGLLTVACGVLKSSQTFHDTALYTIPYNKDLNLYGLACWKPGHIGVGVSTGFCIESKGIDYGVVETSNTKWTELLYLADVDYYEAKYIRPTSPVCRIMWLQHTLNQLGEHLEVDGIFGKRTGAALERFQKKHGYPTEKYLARVAVVKKLRQEVLKNVV